MSETTILSPASSWMTDAVRPTPMDMMWSTGPLKWTVLPWSSVTSKEELGSYSDTEA